MVAAVRSRFRAELIAHAQKRDPRLAPWTETNGEDTGNFARWCVICGWHGHSFHGTRHCESADCPRCGSIARDRFLYLCFVKRVRYRQGIRLLETSPRLGLTYRQIMAKRCHYVSSDYDLRAHQGDVALDLQRLGLASDSVDVLLTAHVLEHLPDTDAALAEMWRVLRPGGRLFLSVPVQQGHTAPPTEPEYHGDQTLVYWRFGLDLTDRLRQHGFVTTVLVPSGYRRLVKVGECNEGNVGGEFDVPSILAAARRDDMQVISDARESRRMGFEPAFMFLVWECLKRP